jgi:hypothetical protein
MKMQKKNETNDAPKRLTININLRTILDEKETDLMVPGFEVPLSPEEADELGAFEETALTYEEAKAATPEVLEVSHESESK